MPIRFTSDFVTYTQSPHDTIFGDNKPWLGLIMQVGGNAYEDTGDPDFLPVIDEDWVCHVRRGTVDPTESDPDADPAWVFSFLHYNYNTVEFGADEDIPDVMVLSGGVAGLTTPSPYEAYLTEANCIVIPGAIVGDTDYTVELKLSLSGTTAELTPFVNGVSNGSVTISNFWWTEETLRNSYSFFTMFEYWNPLPFVDEENLGGNTDDELVAPIDYSISGVKVGTTRAGGEYLATAWTDVQTDTSNLPWASYAFPGSETNNAFWSFFDIEGNKATVRRFRDFEVYSPDNQLRNDNTSWNPEDWDGFPHD